VADDSRLTPDRTVEHATCLGCGCACDDITVVARSGRIAEARNACSLGLDWFGTGAIPARIVSRSGRETVTDAIGEATQLLRAARRPLLFMTTELSCESQRMAIAIADVIGAALDSITTSTVGGGILAAQRRGRVTATLGEIRNRADTIVFWGVDPAARYPRFPSRYAPQPIGLFVPLGRAGRQVIAVDIGGDHGPSDADARVSFAPDEEVAALALARAAVTGALEADAGGDSLEARAVRLAGLVRTARYATIVADGEPVAVRDPQRNESLLLLVEALNHSTRCVLSTLRGGGNRSGADAVMTWQTGFPMAVDFSRGTPSYRPDRAAAALLESGEIDVAVVVGAAHAVPPAVARGLANGVSCVAIGPRASDSSYPVAVAIDTGIAGIHERGSALRMDDVSLPLRPALESDLVSVVYNQAAAGFDVAMGDALARSGRPQDAYLVLRALLAAIARLQFGTGAAARS
jgi:formylmethanofuran dehydrogenase subunit B